jgi:CheY-like chemotaxis protein
MSTNADVEKQRKIFSKYLSDKKIVIADPNKTSRAALANILSQMGAKSINMVLAGSYQVAEEELKRAKPTIVIAEYDMGKRCGLELLQSLRQDNPEFKKCLFVLVTGNGSQSAVARSAEEDVDTFILKPFNQDSLRATIMKTALAKINPSEYMKTIEIGKGQMSEGKFDESIATFKSALKMDKTPSLAYFYIGQAQVLKKMLQEAEGEFSTGLNVNKIHYKCMVGLYDVLATQKQHVKAYDTIKRISQYFPANPQRLAAVLRLAIVTKSYEDVERYYRMFTNMENRNEELVKYICAALVVCGKYYLISSNNTRALEVFKNAAISAGGRTKILREIITTLMEFDLAKQSEEFLKRFPAESRKQADYLTMELLLVDKTRAASAVLDHGRQLLNQGVNDPMIYQVLIRRSAEVGFNDAAEDMVAKASGLYPDKKALFSKILEENRKSKDSEKGEAKAAANPAKAA